MSRCIVFVRGMHLEWSTTLGAPASSGMDRRRMEAHLLSRALTADRVRMVLDAAEANGAAMIDDPQASVSRLDVLSRNALGPEGTCLPARGVVDLLTTGEEILY